MRPSSHNVFDYLKETKPSLPGIYMKPTAYDGITTSMSCAVPIHRHTISYPDDHVVRSTKPRHLVPTMEPTAPYQWHLCEMNPVFCATNCALSCSKRDPMTKSRPEILIGAVGAKPALILRPCNCVIKVNGTDGEVNCYWWPAPITLKPTQTTPYSKLMQNNMWNGGVPVYRGPCDMATHCNMNILI